LVARQALEQDAARGGELNRRRRVNVEFFANFFAVFVVDVDFDANKLARQTSDRFVRERSVEHRLAVRAILRHKEEEKRFVFGFRASRRFGEIGRKIDGRAFDVQVGRDVGDEGIGGKTRFAPTRRGDDAGDCGKRRDPSRGRFYKLIRHCNR